MQFFRFFIRSSLKRQYSSTRCIMQSMRVNQSASTRGELCTRDKVQRTRSQAFLCKRTRLEMQLPVIILTEPSCAVFFLALFSYHLHQSSLPPPPPTSTNPSVFLAYLSESCHSSRPSLTVLTILSPPSHRWFRFIP